MTAPPALTLTYFEFAGRANAIRKTLTMGGVPFVDRRITRDEFARCRDEFPYKKMPVITVDGECIAETQGILRYAAHLAGVYPPVEDPVAAMLVDEILDTFEDLFERLFLPIVRDNDLTKLDGPLQTALTRIDKRLAEIAAYPFFQASTENVFVHEVVVWDYVAMLRFGLLKHIPTSLIEKYQTLVQIHDKVEANPAVDQHQYDARPPATAPLPAKLKLTYFDFHGRAGYTRLALYIGGVAFEDERISFDELDERADEFPNGQLPVLRVNGDVLAAQSLALFRYAGRLTGLYPSDDLVLGMKIDEVIGHRDELDVAMDPSFTEENAEKKREMVVRLVTTTIPESLGGLSGRIDQWKRETKDKTPYAVGGRLTLADLVVYNLVRLVKEGQFDGVPREMVDAYPRLLACYDVVVTHPRVVDWYAQHECRAVE